MINMKRFWQDVQYDLLVPPFNEDVTTMTGKQAKEYYDWFLQHIPERVDYFTKRCEDDLDLPAHSINYDPESLVPIWKWFLSTARLEKMPEEELIKMREGAKIFGDSYITKKRLTVTTHFIIRDIGMFLGEMWIHNYPQLYWTYSTQTKDSICANKPIIAGFQMTIGSVIGDMFFEPIHMVYIQAARLITNTANEFDLFNLYQKWISNIPDL